MRYLLEFVTEHTVLLRHPEMAGTIRRFFADAGSNSVRAFYADDTGLGGYVFYLLNPKNSANEEDTGRYYKLITTVEVKIVQQGSSEPKVIRPRPIDQERIERQFSHNEWFTGPFRGRLDRVAAVHIEEASSEGSETGDDV
jgi:hypothetical protein